MPILVTTYFFWLSLANAQFVCGTLPGPNPIGKIQVAPISQDPIWIRVYFHVIQKDDGTGGVTESQVMESFSILNEHMNPFDIYFVWDCQIDPILNTSYWNNLANYACQVSSINPHSDGIDIYIGPDGNAPIGLAGGIPGKWIVLGGNFQFKVASRSEILIHEMGHCLGLWHTFHGTVNESGGVDCYGNSLDDPDACAECADGSNSINCGDYVQDTPADPETNGFDFSFFDCSWLDDDVDPCTNQLYQPDGKNIMSYARASCLQYLTDGQGDRMRNIISISSLLEDVLTTPPSPPNPSFSFIQLPDCKFQFNTVAQNGYHTWDFGDNSMSNEVNPVHTFSSSGMYHVVHKVIGDNCITESMEIDITISCSSDFVCQCPPNNGLSSDHPEKLLIYQWTILKLVPPCQAA